VDTVKLATGAAAVGSSEYALSGMRLRLIRHPLGFSEVQWGDSGRAWHLGVPVAEMIFGRGG
jgi:hypothetical protein